MASPSLTLFKRYRPDIKFIDLLQIDTHNPYYTTPWG